MAHNSVTRIEVQDRDFTLLSTLLDSRIATSAHIAALHFDSKDAAKKRLQKLKAAGLIGERKRRVNERSILFLTLKAFRLLKDQGVLRKYPELAISSLERRARVSDLTIRHELEVMDVKAAFHATFRGHHRYSIEHFSTWPTLHQFMAFRPDRVEVLIQPDGYIRIHEQKEENGLIEHAFFLEVDRSTEAHAKLIPRVACYLNHYRTGGYALSCGGTRLEYKKYPVRVLLVFKSAERRNNAAAELLLNNPPILTMAYLSTLDEVKGNPGGTIWMRPFNYQEAVKGTDFVPERQGKGHYRRISEREAHVEKTVRKVSLFEG